MQREDGFFDIMLGGSQASAGAAIQAVLGMQPGFVATDQWLERQYGQGGVCARVVDLAAEDCWARGFTIDEDKDDFIADYCEKLMVGIHGPTASKWQSLYGGGAWVVFATDGSSTFQNPLNVNGITSIDKLLPVDAASLSVYRYYEDIYNVKYGEPEIYQVRVPAVNNTKQTGAAGVGNSAVQFLVHETRIICFPGTPLPLNLRMAKRIPWQGRSDLGAVFEDFQRMSDAHKWSVEVLKRKQQAIHKFAGLSGLLVNDFNGTNEAAIRKQISMADAMRNLLNAVTIDGDDEYTVQDLSVVGLVDLIREFKETFAAAAGYPVSVLFGRAASGLSANGDNDLENYYGMISKRQTTRVKPALVQLVTLILLVKGAPKIPKWKIEFEPLWVPSEKDQAQAELFEGQGHQAEATALTSFITEGVMSAAQVTNYLANNHMFGLTPADVIKDQNLLDPNSEINNPPPPVTIVPGAPQPNNAVQVPK
jgi:phage-related protein (TIGR01555 family)